MGNFGMSSATPGTDITASDALNCLAAPKCSRDNAYPASESKKTRPAVTHTVTSIELPGHRVVGSELSPEPKIVFHYRKQIGHGMRASGCALASASVLNNVAT